ncbi:MAG: translation initiation inhibitor [Prevotella micans]|nr:translation initiation inhibitor [Prevotella micans]
MNTYRILSASPGGKFEEQLESLNTALLQFLEDENKQKLQYIKVFLSDIQNQYEPLLTSELYKTFANKALTVVGQPPLNGSKISLLIITANKQQKQLLHALRLTDEEAGTENVYEQTLRLFEMYIDAAKVARTEMKTHLVRTWIYVADIDTNYSSVVKARNDIFSRHGLTPETHFIASTGIGGYSAIRQAKVAIDFLTYPDIKEHDKKYLQALNHLNPTHEYGVAFERGTRVNLGNEQEYFISGTASIDKNGSVLHIGDVKAQAIRLLDNIEALLKDGEATLEDVNYFVIYLRDPSDYSIVDEYMQNRFPRTPRVIVYAKICRPEWLIEMECTATRKYS